MRPSKNGGITGRGFAVVAEEVRVLAGNASDAARQINDLVKASSKEVASGVELIGHAATTLHTIVESFGKVVGLSSEIAAASSQQSSALSEVNSAITQMDTVTQQNAAMVEETTAADNIMSQHAQSVSQLLAKLKTETVSIQTTPRSTPEASSAA